MRTAVARQLAPTAAGSRSCCSRSPSSLALPRRAPRARPATLAAAGHSQSLMASVEQALAAAEACVDRLVADVRHSAGSRLQACLLGLLLFAQRLVRWVQLSAVALQLQRHAQEQRQQEMQLAYAGVGPSGGGDAGSVGSSGDAAPRPSAPAAAAGNVMGFVSAAGAAATGAVEQLRHTLCDATQGIDTKMSAIERTAADLQGTLFRAAQAHQEAVRSNPERGMWKQPSVEAVISEEERLRQAVFQQVYAELLQKDNSSISYTAQGP